MKQDLINILANSNKDIDNQKLMDYISGKLSERDKQEVEQALADSPFMNDAAEGLENLADKQKLQAYVDQLNKELHAQLEKKKSRRLRKGIREYPFVYLAIILILTLCIIGYVIIRMFLK